MYCEECGKDIKEPNEQGPSPVHRLHLCNFPGRTQLQWQRTHLWVPVSSGRGGVNKRPQGHWGSDGTLIH